MTSADFIDVWFTFGVQYGRYGETHPVFPLADGDGWLRVRANDYETARAKAYEVTGGKFAFDYLERPEPIYAPLGELAFIDVSTK